MRLSIGFALTLGAFAGPLAAFAALQSPSNLPVYPGAIKIPTPLSSPTKSCGHEMMLIVYRSTAGAESVRQWYAGKMPGSTSLKITSPSSGVSGFMIVAQGGATAVTISRPPGEARTVIGLYAYDPPYGARDIALLRAVQRGDAAAKATAKRLCGEGD
jgi:hypothetical protein